VTPLHELSYPDQLKKKHDWLRGVLDTFSSQLEQEVKNGTEEAPSWYRQMPKIPLNETVIANSERIDAYRNKVEFTIGHKYDFANKC
jgi:tRNA/tmRNA/rRNA uracil-C5-methylase (TrmA/RlmC/RlmD family)